MERRATFDPSGIPRARIVRKPYVAEIIHDRRVAPGVYHCLIQKLNSNEIVAWDQCRDLAAEVAVQEYFSELVDGRSPDRDRFPVMIGRQLCWGVADVWKNSLKKIKARLKIPD